MHDRYFAPHKPRGTPPSPKTARRLFEQWEMGLNPYRREIVRDDGSIIHPTKGFGSAFRRTSRVAKSAVSPKRMSTLKGKLSHV